jgi:hypothetical protein
VPALPDVLAKSGVEAARARSLLQILLREKRLIRVGDDLVFHHTAMEKLRTMLAARQAARFNVGTFKDWTGISRKYAIPLLEYLDRERSRAAKATSGWSYETSAPGYNHEMATQNYSNHVRLVPASTSSWRGILLLTLIGSLVNLLDVARPASTCASIASRWSWCSRSAAECCFITSARLAVQSAGPRHTRRGKPAPFRADGQIARCTSGNAPDHRAALRAG